MTQSGESSSEDLEALARRAYATAVKLLGPRDHSREELRGKLLARGFEAELSDKTLSELESLGYLDDARFAARFAEQRSAGGHGPLSIRSKLSQRGVQGDLISEAITSLSCDWSEVAAEALERKFTLAQLNDTDDRVRGRIARFLQSHGFSRSDALSAVKRVRQGSVAG